MSAKRLLSAIGLLIAMLALPCVAVAQPSMCEDLYDLDEGEREDLAQQVHQAGRIPEIGVLNGGGMRFAPDGRAQYRLELSLGVTYAARRDIYSICEHGHLPAGLGVHAFAGTAGFRSWLLGGYFRYYNQLNTGALVPVWELGGGAHVREGDWAPSIRVGAGIGNLFAQLMVLADIVDPAEDTREAIVTLNLRLHWEAIRFLL